MAKTIWTTHADRERLLALVDSTNGAPDRRELQHIQELTRELLRANIFESASRVPRELITMRSQVRLKNLSTGRELQCTLVYPNESNPEAERISVLAPLGTAMLGHRAGDSFKVQLPKGETKFRVEAVIYQPEAAGDLHL